MKETKVIAFSLWGNKLMYINGAVRNAELKAKIYPEWNMRYYVDSRILDDHKSEIDTMVGLGAEIIEKPPCDDYMGLYWRMEVGYDDSVDRFIIRDTDSRLNIREAAAVKEWENSQFAVHLMRDHLQYHRVYILGGMWGAKKGFMPDYREKLEWWIANGAQPRNHSGKPFWGSDQVFLKQYVWPHIRPNHMCHDDSRRVTHAERRFRVFLPERSFVGQQYDEHDNLIWP